MECPRIADLLLFEGRLRRTGRAAEFLRGLVEVVQLRFYLPPATARIMAKADPVVTGSGGSASFRGLFGVLQHLWTRRFPSGGDRWHLARAGHDERRFQLAYACRARPNTGCRPGAPGGRQR